MMDAIKCIGKGETAMLFGLTVQESEISITPFDIFRRGIAIKASYINPYTQKRAIWLLISKKIDVKSIIENVVRLDEINDIFESDKYTGKGKVILAP